jgi:hypothetical protein
MNIRPDLRMSKAAFIEWEPARGNAVSLLGDVLS